MKTPLLLLGLALAATCLEAAGLYPSILTVKYNDRMLPVVSVHGTDPIVVVGGKEKEIRSAPVFFVQSAPGFADNFVSAPPNNLAGGFRSNTGSITTGYYHVTMTAQKTIRHGFAVVITYADLEKTKELREKALGLTDKDKAAVAADAFLSGTSIVVHDLPELPAGQPVNVKFSDAMRVGLLATDYFTQIFDDEGREVPTTDMKYAGAFFLARDRVRTAPTKERYLETFKAQDHDAAPVLTPKPYFPPGTATPTDDVSVMITVEADGHVSDVDASEVQDEKARQCIVDALGGWIFFPRLKAGQPIPTKIKVPLRF